MLPTRPPIDQTTVSAQPPRLGLYYERGRLPNEQLRNAANPAQEHRWLVKPNPCGRTCVWSIWPWDVNAPCGSPSLSCDATITINILKIPPCFPAGYANYGRFSWKRFPKQTSFGNRIFLKYSKFKKTCQHFTPDRNLLLNRSNLFDTKIGSDSTQPTQVLKCYEQFSFREPQLPLGTHQSGWKVKEVKKPISKV